MAGLEEAGGTAVGGWATLVGPAGGGWVAGLVAVPAAVAAAGVGTEGTGAVALDVEGGVTAVGLTCSLMAVVRMIISLSGQATLPVPPDQTGRGRATKAGLAAGLWLLIVSVVSGQGKGAPDSKVEGGLEQFLHSGFGACASQFRPSGAAGCAAAGLHEPRRTPAIPALPHEGQPRGKRLASSQGGAFA